MTALWSAFAPSITTRMARLGSSPRSIRSASSALQDAVFSVAPSRNPKTWIAPHQFSEPALGADYEAFAHRALARATDLELVRQGFQRARISARRDSQHHLLEGALIQRVALTSTPASPARLSSCPSTPRARGRSTFTRRPPITSEARHVPGAQRLALSQMCVARSAQRSTLRFHFFLDKRQSR